MKKISFVCLLAALVLIAHAALAAGEPDYTLSKKNSVVLQNAAERTAAVSIPAAGRAIIPGESPVTGLSWEGRYLPVLAQIGNNTDTVQVKGYSVKASGIGKYTPWGLQYADILYEEPLYASGNTRFAALFSDCFAQGEPAAGVGPVRSCRYGPLVLRAQWQAVLMFGGGYGSRGDSVSRLLSDPWALEQGLLINIRSAEHAQMADIVRNGGKKAPSNVNGRLMDARAAVPQTYIAQPHPFLFQDGGAYAGDYDAATVIHLDWGYKYNISHFVYREAEGVYSRFCGAGKDFKKWAPFASWTTAQDTGETEKVALSFANVIIQRVAFSHETGNDLRPILQLVGSGNADIFIDGVYIPGVWVCEDETAPTVFYDGQGNEIRFNRGKTNIAHFPAQALLTFTAE